MRRDVLRRLLRQQGWVLLYLALIVLCVVYAPTRPLKFIYTEF
jgi:hypothetical protein